MWEIQIVLSLVAVSHFNINFGKILHMNIGPGGAWWNVQHLVGILQYLLSKDKKVFVFELGMP
jgi:hypothetical protein